MHSFIDTRYQRPRQGRKSADPPLHNRMTPIRRARPSKPLRSSAPTYTPQHSLHKDLRTRHHQAGPPDLAHRTRHEIRLYQLHCYTVRLQLARQSGRPVLQESLTAAISRE